MRQRSAWIEKNLGFEESSPKKVKDALIDRDLAHVDLTERVARTDSIPHLFKLLEKAEENSTIILQKIATLINFELEEAPPKPVNARGKRRDAAIKRATPPWLTKEHREMIDQKSELARRLTKTTGIPHAVDHIAPIQGDNISGLHVPWNMQVITARQNSKKSNKFPYEVLDIPEKEI